MDVLQLLAGAALAGVVYFLYRCARDGVPAVLAWIKAKWNAGRTELGALSDDIEHVHGRIDALERMVGDLANEVGLLGGRGSATAPVPSAATVAATAQAAHAAAPSFLTQAQAQ